MKKCIGYIKECTLVDCNGTSLGEAPHYTLHMIHPEEKELYLTDDKTDIKESIIEQLLNENIIDNKNNYDIENDISGMINVVEIKDLFTSISKEENNEINV